MKIYDENKKLKKMFCNQCGRQLRTENGMLMEAAYEGRQNFGYFSHKDGVTHSFDLCEACYDKLIGTFAIPVTETEEFEWQAEYELRIRDDRCLFAGNGRNDATSLPLSDSNDGAL